eukprot:scaffold53827_cov28-Tisochrysis_lutea.AAC.11
MSEHAWIYISELCINDCRPGSSSYEALPSSAARAGGAEMTLVVLARRMRRRTKFPGKGSAWRARPRGRLIVGAAPSPSSESNGTSVASSMPM